VNGPKNFSDAIVNRWHCEFCNKKMGLRIEECDSEKHKRTFEVIVYFCTECEHSFISTSEETRLEEIEKRYVEDER
jgi:hypothetical protein